MQAIDCELHNIELNFQENSISSLEILNEYVNNQLISSLNSEEKDLYAKFYQVNE
jgi:hypothetical protein